MMPINDRKIRSCKTKPIKYVLKLYGFGWFIKTDVMVYMNQVFAGQKWWR